MEDERDESLVPDTERNSGKPGIGQKVGNAAKEKGKDAAKKLAKKAAKKGASKGAATAAAGPVIFWATVVIVVIIILVGIIMFFATMPGMVMEKLKELFKALGDAIASFFGADTTIQIEDDQIYETLDYLENMGYDLKGYGFLHGYFEKSDENTSKIEDQLSDDQKKAGYFVDKNIGVVRESGSNKIILAKSDYIFTYIASENYAYTLKNHNLVTKKNGSGGLLGFITDIYEGAKAAISNAIHFLGLDTLTQSVFKMFGVYIKTPYDAWGEGFLAIYEEDGTEEGKLAADGTLFNWDSISVDVEKRILSIQRTEFLNGNNPMQYSLDGWTGRYSMPIDFLLSVHIATMMPDLAYDMATGFNTVARIFLHEAEGEAIAAYKTTNGTYETYSTINSAINQGDGRNIFSIFFSWIDSWWTTDDEMKKAQELGIRHTPKCEAGNGAGGAGECTYTEEAAYQIMYDDKIRQVIMNKGAYAKAYQDFSDKLDPGKAYCLNVEDIGERTIGELYDAGLLIEIPEEYEGDITKVPNESHKVYTEYCSECKEYLELVVDVLEDIDDGSYAYYIPYLKDVTNHWYRDVYFWYKKDSFDKKVGGDQRKEYMRNFVDIDTDYEAIYKERWTLYEVYEETDTSEYAQEHLGDFKLYLINTGTKGWEGSYETTAALSSLYPQEAIDRLEREGDYWLFLGTQDEAAELGIKVSKKAITLNGDKLANYGWVKDGSEWSAYLFATENKQDYYTPAFSKEAIAEESSANKRSVMENVYMKILSNANVIQVGEGMRTETNPRIKKMFLSDTYFRYDGTHKTAEIITELRNKICSDLNDGAVDEWYNREEPASPYGAINELRDHDGYIVGEKYLDDEYELTIDGKTDKYKVSDYSGQVVLSQDSLNAFAMLENSHTLDADYIYRDFKELIVELGYFTKEELTDEIPEVFAFPVVKTGSYLYPDRKIDKRENEYGTMIHSAGDIAANAVYLGVQEDTKNDAGFGKVSGYNEAEQKAIQEKKEKTYRGYNGNEAVVSPVTGILLEYGTYDETMKDSLTEEQYRVNVDLKYGPLSLTPPEDDEDEDEEDKGQIVSDKVGYAKILVLDTENYLKMEQSIESMWKGNSLFNVRTGKYENPLVGSNVPGGDTAEKMLNGWTEDDKTVYGFKEFAETYKTTGIEGYILVIDGFVCEEPDSSLMGSKIFGKTPTKGVPITMDSYKQNKPTGEQMPTVYTKGKVKQLANVTAKDKLKAEDMVKEAARSVYYLADEDLIFIKEGTILGRTMTDDELRNGNEIRDNSSGVNYDTGIVGNYIRMILRDLDATPVEDIEDMIKKDEITKTVNVEASMGS